MRSANHRILGVDIGGANLKIADCSGQFVSEYFPMWTDHAKLAQRLAAVFETMAALHPSQPLLAITMTGELADCFATRREGVASILNQVSMCVDNDSRVHVYAVDGQWLSTREAAEDPWRVAASNWHALATWVSREFAEDDVDLVVDIGSTTVDVIPIDSHGVTTVARTDRDRMQAGQLLYTGIERTPVCAILPSVDIDGVACPLMAEVFATSVDAYLCLGLLPEEPNNNSTADGRGRTRSLAAARLARMIGEDLEHVSVEVTESIAKQIVDRQASQVAAAMLRNLSHRSATTSGAVRVVLSGHGWPMQPALKRQLEVSGCDFQFEFLPLHERISPEASRGGPALAVARLLANHLAIS